MWITVLNLASGAIFVMIPLLYRFGELVAPLVFFFVAYASITVLCWRLGTGSGLPFYYLVAATLMVLILGVEHIVLASVLAALGAATVIALAILVPYNTGVQPDWAFTIGFHPHRRLRVGDGRRGGLVRDARDPSRPRCDGGRI